MLKDEILFFTISPFILFSISIIRLASSCWNWLPQIRDRCKPKAPLLYARFLVRCLQVSLFTALIALNRCRSRLEIQTVIKNIAILSDTTFEVLGSLQANLHILTSLGCTILLVAPLPKDGSYINFDYGYSLFQRHDFLSLFFNVSLDYHRNFSLS